MTKMRTNQLSQTGATTDQTLVWNGSEWLPAALAASKVPFTPAGTVTATTVQGALAELAAGRATATYTTAVLANAASEVGLLSLAAGYRLYSISTDKPARVRLYTSATKRDADVSRPVGTDPSGNHGVMLDFVTTTDMLSATLSPMVDGYAESGTSAAITVNNLGASGTVTVTLTYLRTE